MKKALIILLFMLPGLTVLPAPPLEDLVQLPSKVLKRRHKSSLQKGRELYKLGEYQKSLPWLDDAILYSQALIAQAKLREIARRKLAEAKQLVDRAGKQYHQ